MGMVLLISIGLGAGIIARLLFLHDAPGGWLLPLLLGVAGATFAGVVTQWPTGFHDDITIQKAAGAVMGAAWMLFGFRLDVSRSRSRHDRHSCRR